MNKRIQINQQMAQLEGQKSGSQGMPMTQKPQNDKPLPSHHSMITTKPPQQQSLNTNSPPHPQISQQTKITGPPNQQHQHPIQSTQNKIPQPQPQAQAQLQVQKREIAGIEAKSEEDLMNEQIKRELEELTSTRTTTQAQAQTKATLSKNSPPIPHMTPSAQIHNMNNTLKPQSNTSSFNRELNMNTPPMNTSAQHSPPTHTNPFPNYASNSTTATTTPSLTQSKHTPSPPSYQIQSHSQNIPPQTQTHIQPQTHTQPQGQTQTQKQQINPTSNFDFGFGQSAFEQKFDDKFQTQFDNNDPSSFDFKFDAPASTAFANTGFTNFDKGGEANFEFGKESFNKESQFQFN
jgi:hypothetical protein